MSVRLAILTSIGGLLGLLMAIYAVRIAGHYPAARIELGQIKMTQLAPSTRETLGRLHADVLITYYISGREHLPSRMRRIEQSVVDLLEAMKGASRGRLIYQIVDPERDAELAERAAYERVAPFRVRSVTRDEYSEKTVWSTLRISYGAHLPAAINGVGPEMLPHLQSLIIGQLRQMEQPRPPVYGLDAPPGYGELEAYLRSLGEVRHVDVASGEPIPEEIDLLFWLEPENVLPREIRSLSAFLESGRSAVIAGSRHRVEVTQQLPQQELAIRPTRYNAQEVLSAFALRPIADVLVLDELAQHIEGETGPRRVPFVLRAIAPNQDFRLMRSVPNGHLLFVAPTPLAFDGEGLAQAGYTPTVLASSSNRTRVRELTYGDVDLTGTEWLGGEAAPKLPLLVWLRPHEPWRGSVVFAGSSSPFQDGTFFAEAFAHQRLVETLTETLASDERLVIHRAAIARPQPIPELAPGQRLFWRAICVVLLPLAVLGVALWRGAFQLDRLTPAPSRARWPKPIMGRGMVDFRPIGVTDRGIPALAATGLLAVLIAVAAASASGWRVDLTEGRINELAPETARLAAGAVGRGRIDATLYFSRHDRLPPELRPPVRRLRALLRELARAGADISVAVVRPEALTAAELDTVHARGIQPERFTSRDEESAIARTVYGTLSLESNGRTELLHFPDRAAFDHLEFRLAFALWRLQTGRQPHIAFIAATPRLTPAEVYEDFQQRNLQAPTGSDPYSQARDFLERNDFLVTHVPPGAELPDEADFLIWVQPRRDIRPVLDQLIWWLRSGRPAMVASQHFYMQARQYRGNRFGTVYWPQPQATDLETGYFPALGIELKREVLFDEMKAPLDLTTHVNVESDRREYQRQDSALPFLVRAVAANFNGNHTIMRGVGDQLLPFASYFQLDHDRLNALGLGATVLMASSARAWSFVWTGGVLPEPLLGQRPIEEAPESIRLLDRVPLAVLVRGRFPLPEALPTDGRTSALQVDAPRESSGAEGEAELLLLGNSYLFRNELMSDREFRPDHLLLNIAAHFSLGGELTAVAGHRRALQGFDAVDFEDRVRWRLIVLTAGPALMLLVAAAWVSTRRRSLRIMSGRT